MERARMGCVEVVWQHPAAPGDAITLSQVTAKFEPSKFGRRSCPAIEQQINKLWEAKCVKNSRLYNGDKFRLAGWCSEEGQWSLHVGLTSYKDLCGTNLAHNAPSLQEKGSKDFGNAQAYMSDPIGVGVLVVTSDECLVVGRRAGWTGESPGALDRPGGHPEPERVLTAGHIHSALDDAVLREVWTSAAQEIEDEVGIPKDQLGHLTLLGIVLNMEAGGRPSLEFFTRCELSSSEVLQVYHRGSHAEVDETTSLHLLPPPTLASLPELLQSPPPSENCDESASWRRQGNMGSNGERGSESGVRESERGEREGESEARWVVEEATPALKGALLLALQHNLLPRSHPPTLAH